MILYLFTIKQDYIELTDQSISICSRQFQSSTSIFLGMMLRQTKQRNKNYQYSELEKVEIKLVFSTMGGGASGPVSYTHLDVYKRQQYKKVYV